MGGKVAGGVDGWFKDLVLPCGGEEAWRLKSLPVERYTLYGYVN